MTLQSSGAISLYDVGVELSRFGSVAAPTKFSYTSYGESFNWTVPVTGSYRFILVGAGGSAASGGSSGSIQNGNIGGYGGVVDVTIYLTAGKTLNMYIGRGAPYNQITYANGGSYPLRGGSGTTGGGAGGGGTGIYDGSPANANYGGWLAIAGGGGGAASHGFDGNVGGQGIGLASSGLNSQYGYSMDGNYDGRGFGWTNSASPAPVSGSSYGAYQGGFASGQLTGGSGSTSNAGNGGGGGGGGAGGGGGGAGGGSFSGPYDGYMRGGYFNPMSYTNWNGFNYVYGGEGGGGHDNNCGGTGGGGGSLAFNAYTPKVYWVPHDTMRSIKSANNHGNTKTASNYLNQATAIVQNAGLSWTDEGTPGYTNQSGATANAGNGAIFLVSVPASGGGSGSTISMNDTDVRTLAGRSGSGTYIAMNDFYGKSKGSNSSPINVLWIANESAGYATQCCNTLKAINNAVGYASASTWTAVDAQGDIPQVYSASSYDVVIWSNDYQGAGNTWSTIQNFLNANKGFIMLVFGHTNWQASTLYSNIGYQWQITNIGSYSSYNTFQSISGSSSIMNGVSQSSNQGWANFQFTPVNSASYADTTNSQGFYQCIYKDFGSASRRVDINSSPLGSWGTASTTYNDMGRLIVNACYWAAKRTN